MTRRHPGKEAGVVVDFVHPATKHDDPVVTLHSLLERDVYRGGAIVVGPVRRGRGRRVRVERRVIPVTADENRRHEVFERELWRIAVEHLDYGEQHMWAALAGARVQTSGWRRARAMLHFDRSGELKRRFLLTAVERNKNSQLRIRALQEIAALKDPEAFDLAIDQVGGWGRDERREAAKVLFTALAEKRIGRRDQANAWIWRLAECTRDVHEEYAVQRWPETKRLLGLLVNSAGGAHARNARRLVQAARTQDRRLQAALLAAAVAHTPEAEEVLRGARTRLSRKPGSLSRELLRNFPKGKGRRGRRRRKKTAGRGRRRGRGASGRDCRSARSRRPRTSAAPTAPDATATSRRRRAHQVASRARTRRRRRWRPRPTRTTAAATSRRPLRPDAGRDRRPCRATARRHRPSLGIAVRTLTGVPRWTSPASSSVRPPPSSSTTSLPVPSIPAPTPLPPAQLTGRPASASRPRSSASTLARRRRQQTLELAQHSIADVRDGARLERERRRAAAQLRRQVGEPHGDVDADPDHRPALLRARLGEHARELAQLAARSAAARRSAT